MPAIGTMMRAFVDPRARYELIQFVKQTQWQAGIWNRPDLGMLHRAMLVSALIAGRVGKAVIRWKRRRKAR